MKKYYLNPDSNLNQYHYSNPSLNHKHYQKHIHNSNCSYIVAVSVYPADFFKAWSLLDCHGRNNAM